MASKKDPKSLAARDKPAAEDKKKAVGFFKKVWHPGRDKAAQKRVSSEAERSEREPGKPVRQASTSDSITISWQKPTIQLQHDNYEVRYKKTDTGKWLGSACTKDDSVSLTVEHLDCGREYIFKVRTMAEDGDEGPFSTESDVIITEANTTNQQSRRAAGIPCCIDATASEITIIWEEPKDAKCDIAYYELKYRTSGGKQWNGRKTDTKSPSLKITELKCNEAFQFKVRAITVDGDEGPFSEVSPMVETKTSLAQRFLPSSKEIRHGPPVVFKLPLTFTQTSLNASCKTRKGVFGKRDPTAIEKTIMVVGATGAGKSTLIDGMINYILDVAWEDESRFSLIDLTQDEKQKENKQAESQTEWVTCYNINKIEGSQIKYNLNIIDTPGFGDTRGIARDKQIVDQIREFFTTPGDQGIDTIDAVCFVTQSPLARLTPPQKYIFDAILSVFGNDIKDNIFVLITFADGKEPPVKAALQSAGVPFRKSFVFNNSALFVDPRNSEESQFGQMFWKMGKESFRIFFKELYKVETKSLKLTSEVLQTRKKLEATIQGLQPQIQEGLHGLDMIRQERKVLEGHKADIAKNKDFTYTVTEIRQNKLDLDPQTYVTNCLTCNKTCHHPCCIPKDSDKAGCAAMKGDICTVCPGKCHWSSHVNNSYRFETYTVPVNKTYYDLEQKYQSAQSEERKQTGLLDKVKNAFKIVGTRVGNMIQDVRKCINTLNQIALKPNPLSEVEYIDLLIESEKSDRNGGYLERIQMLMAIRREADLMQKIPNGEFNPWDDADVMDTKIF